MKGSRLQGLVAFLAWMPPNSVRLGKLLTSVYFSYLHFAQTIISVPNYNRRDNSIKHLEMILGA